MPESKNNLTNLVRKNPGGLSALTQRTEGKDLTLENNQEAKFIPLDRIVENPNQPRRTFDPASLKELADDIGVRGVLQPILVRPVKDGKYEIIAGERRFQASRQAGMTTIPAIVKRDIQDREARYVSLVENIQRQDLDPVDEGRYFSLLTNEYNLSEQDIADKIHKSKSYVHTKISAARQADEQARSVVAENTLQTPTDSDKSNNRAKKERLLHDSQSSLSKSSLSRAVASFKNVAQRATTDLPLLSDDERAALDTELEALEDMIRAIRAQLS